MNSLVFLILLLSTIQDPQIPPIGIIDFYGLRTVTEQQVRAALQIKEGDSLSDEPKEAKRRLESLPGVTEVRISFGCCDSGKATLSIGIREKGTPATQFRPAPQGKVRLPKEITRAGEDFQRVFEDAVLKGNADEDRSAGHALMNDPASRAIQKRFLIIASRDLKLLREVLRDSSDAGHRALAAQVIAYTNDKQSVVTNLVQAMRDPDENVRNNAMRALAVMAEKKTRQIQIPARPLIDMLNSIEWTDRNKSSLALLGLTQNRDLAILTALRQTSLLSLVEMARWKSSGHAYTPFVLLGRVAGLPEDQINAAWERGERTSFIEEAAKRAKAK